MILEVRFLTLAMNLPKDFYRYIIKLCSKWLTGHLCNYAPQGFAGIVPSVSASTRFSAYVRSVDVFLPYAF